MDNTLIGYIRQAVRNGESANRSLEALRQTGHGIRRADYLALYREVSGAIKAQLTGIDRPGNRRPTRREIAFISSATATGFMQYVDVWVKDRETGEVYPRPYGLRTDDLMTHDDAIETALDRMVQHAEKYNETVLGASYMATYEFVPESQ